MKKQNGITLIALVITIIVLLILAGVSIAMLTGENGILTKANESRTASTEGEKLEAVKLALAEIVANKLSDSTTLNTINKANIQTIVTRDNSNAGTLDLTDVNGTGEDASKVISVTFVNGAKTYTIDAETAKITEQKASTTE